MSPVARYLAVFVTGIYLSIADKKNSSKILFSGYCSITVGKLPLDLGQLHGKFRSDKSRTFNSNSGKGHGVFSNQLANKSWAWGKMLLVFQEYLTGISFYNNKFIWSE
jgi:hypothetical protein